MTMNVSLSRVQSKSVKAGGGVARRVARATRKAIRRRRFGRSALRVRAEREARDRGSVDVCFRSPWPEATLHYSLNGGEWRDVSFAKVGEGPWQIVSVPLKDVGTTVVNRENGTPLLEFVMTDLNECCSKGGNFSLGTGGKYAVRQGMMERIALKPVMVVSDLDGTMIGDDAATRSFSQFWDRHSALTHSTLVYNTGRSLESFLQLLKDKAHCLKTPNVLISAVGTKIYTQENGAWAEDPDWVGLLDEDWHLPSVQTAVQAALELVGSENMHLRPDAEQNAHKVTCGVKRAALDKVTATLQERLNETQVNIIWSGIGEWRFLDVVSKKAGKLEALDHVRQKHGFSEAETVACGDSGNDILMLSGRNLAIVVGNAQPDLMDWVRATQKEDDQRLFLAHQHEALGILEGLKKFGFY